MKNKRHVTGKVAEFLASALLAALGWSVWTPTMTQSRADLMISQGELALKVQVKKASWSRSGSNQYLQCRLTQHCNRPYRDGDYDRLVVIDDAWRVWMIPYKEIRGLASLCLDARGPTANKRGAYSRKRYNSDAWIVPESMDWSIL